ncbi:MAG: hypothetical protein EOM25_13710 [Deltaproteobacteria bacterium]|nr:hypothetical protein [Deltaproteobacteria bacterium]
MSIKFFKLDIVLVFVLAVFCGCNDSSNSEDNKNAFNSEAGFYELDIIDYAFRIPGRGTTNAASSKARIFYSYHPGDNLDRDGRNTLPLFVFLNGGPGCATTLNLFAMNTAPYTLDKSRTDGKMYAKNPYSWTSMGNLLYIDAPNTGFSYNMIENPQDRYNRIYEFVPQKYNPLLDAAQMVRIILEFLDKHSGIGANKVILVGESYGGTRVSAMLNMLLFHAKYSESGTGIYQDDQLVERIEKHFNRFFPNQEVTPELVASQFNRQILIQPQLAGPYQEKAMVDAYFGENSIIDQLAEVQGKVWNRECPGIYYNVSDCVTLDFVPKTLNLDSYNYTRNSTWTDDNEAFSTQSLLDIDALSTVLGGIDVRGIEKLKPSSRTQACRYSGIMDRKNDDENYFFLDPEYTDFVDNDFAELLEEMLEQQNYIASQVDQTKNNTLVSVLGKLETWDDYLIGTNVSVFLAYASASAVDAYKTINADVSPIYGEMFLNNLALVDTFLTDSELDLIIYSPALTESLASYTKIVDSVEVVQGTDETNERTPGLVTINFIANSLKDVESTPTSKTLYYPYYSKSGHSVSSSQPEEFRQDVMNWLAAE